MTDHYYVDTSPGWEALLVPAEPRMLGWLFDITDDDSYPGTWEDEVNPWDVGLMALHMEYSEPWDYVWRKEVEQ